MSSHSLCRLFCGLQAVRSHPHLEFVYGIVHRPSISCFNSRNKLNSCHSRSKSPHILSVRAFAFVKCLQRVSFPDSSFAMLYTEHQKHGSACRTFARRWSRSKLMEIKRFSWMLVCSASFEFSFRPSHLSMNSFTPCVVCVQKSQNLRLVAAEPILARGIIWPFSNSLHSLLPLHPTLISHIPSSPLSASASGCSRPLPPTFSSTAFSDQPEFHSIFV